MVATTPSTVVGTGVVVVVVSPEGRVGVILGGAGVVSEEIPVRGGGVCAGVALLSGSSLLLSASTPR